MAIQLSDVMKETYSTKSSPFPFLPLKELDQLLKIKKSSRGNIKYQKSETTAHSREESEIEQLIYYWLTHKISRYQEQEEKSYTPPIQTDYIGHYISFQKKPEFEQEEKRQELKQKALFEIAKKFSKIEKVKSIYVQRYREELQIQVLISVNLYDSALMDTLLDIEYNIRKMFPEIVFEFFYPPAGISEKKDFIHPQAECIYVNKNISLTSQFEENAILDELKEIYEFSNIEKIKNFILQNSHLFKILKEAPEHIYRIFGKETKLVLELHSDPEENWDELFIIIKSSFSPKKVCELEKKLFDEWLAGIINMIGNKLNFTEEPL